MLTQHQRDEFETHGLLKLPEAIPAATATRMAEQTLEYLATEESIQRNRGQGWLTERPAGMQPLTRAGTFDAVAEGSVPVALDDLYGQEGWRRPKNWGRALVTFRTADEWDVPTGGWHLDGIPTPTTTQDPSAITVFVILAPLRPRGGGTLIITGSHRLLRAHAPTTSAARQHRQHRLQGSEEQGHTAEAGRPLSLAERPVEPEAGCDLRPQGALPRGHGARRHPGPHGRAHRRAG